MWNVIISSKINIVSANNIIEYDDLCESKYTVSANSSVKGNNLSAWSRLKQVGGSRRSTYATETRCATWFSIAVRRSTYKANGIPHVTKLC